MPDTSVGADLNTTNPDVAKDGWDAPFSGRASIFPGWKTKFQGVLANARCRDPNTIIGRATDSCRPARSGGAAKPPLDKAGVAPEDGNTTLRDDSAAAAKKSPCARERRHTVQTRIDDLGAIFFGR